MIPDRGVATQSRPISARWQVFALLGMAAAAVAIGTIARGWIFVTDWVLNADNLADSLPLALPFLVSGGVMLGGGRWPAGPKLLVIGAVALALSGALAVATDVTFALMLTGAGLQDTPWLPPIGILLGASSTVGFSALAIGIWRSRPRAWSGLAAAVALAVGLVVAVAAAGPMVTTALTLEGTPVSPYLLSTGLATASVAATGALAVASMRAMPTRTRLPELLIAAGATTHAVIQGGSWWVLGMVDQDAGALELLTFASPVGYAALLAIAAGFASGALFSPAER